MILSYLPFTTLRTMMYLSKECYALINRLKYKADDIYLISDRRISENGFGDIVIRVIIVWKRPRVKSCTYMSPDTYELSFTDRSEGGCFVMHGWNYFCGSHAVGVDGTGLSAALESTLHDRAAHDGIVAAVANLSFSGRC
ncbi:hypothetical protein Y032_0122g1097 [Ancylostoma ceylanicum]|nr:hypothetical protein Y032_0122g1097 [Ancylostoma ceylanicum]